MATFAELMASIELVNKAVAKVAEVAAALSTPVTPQPELPPLVPSDPVRITRVGPGERLLVEVDASLKTIEWSLVRNEAPYEFYGPRAKGPVPTKGLMIDPPYKNNGDFLKVIYGDKWKDGPKDTIAPPAATNPPPAGNNNAQQKFVAPMLFGNNWERVNFKGMKVDGAAMNTRAPYDYCNTVGVNWSRFFTPMNFEMDRGCGVGIPGDWSIDELIDCAMAANMAGHRVIYGALDILGDAELANWDKITYWVDRASDRVRERGCDPTMFAMETCNEMAAGDNAKWNGPRNELHRIIRKNLPNHRIVHGGPGWNGWQGYNDSWESPPDSDVIVQFHHYEQRSDWSEVRNALQAFTQKRGHVVINGEINAGFDKMDQQSHQGIWGQNFKDFASTMGGMPMCAWATIGDKHDFRLNRSGVDARFTPSLEKDIKAASDTIRITKT